MDFSKSVFSALALTACLGFSLPPNASAQVIQDDIIVTLQDDSGDNEAIILESKGTASNMRGHQPGATADLPAVTVSDQDGRVYIRDFILTENRTILKVPKSNGYTVVVKREKQITEKRLRR